MSTAARFKKKLQPLLFSGDNDRSPKVLAALEQLSEAGIEERGAIFTKQEVVLSGNRRDAFADRVPLCNVAD